MSASPRCLIACLVIACGEPRPTVDATPAKSIEPTVEPAPPVSRIPPRPLAEVVALVPERATKWLAIRDSFALLDGLEWATRGQRDEWALLSREYAPGDFAELVAALPLLDTQLGGSGVHLDRGVAIGDVDDATVVVIAAETPEDFPRLIRTIGGRDTAIVCDPVAQHPGFHVCATTASARTAYRPRGAAAIPDDDVALLAEIAGVSITATPRDATLHLAARAPGVDLGVPRVPSTMAAMIAGSSILWMNDDPVAMAERVSATLNDAELVTDLLLATSGEWFLSSPGGPLGLVLISGAKKPAVLRKLVKRVPELAPFLQSLLPGLRVSTETRTSDGHTFELAVAEQDLDEKQREWLESFELQPRAMLIASDTWLIGSIGLGESALGELFEHPIGAVPEGLLGALPPAMASALVAGRSSLALHLELDGLHAPDVRGYLLEAFGRGQFLLGDLEESTALLSLMSAVSSVSMWSDIDADGAGGTLHVAVRAFGHGQGEEGQAAYTARLNVEDGESAALIYGALRSSYRDSPRAHAYVARAGIGGLLTAYPAVANLLMVDSLIRAARRSRASPLDVREWFR